MPEKITNYILNEDLYNDDIDKLLEDKLITITVERKGTTGDGINIELANYTSIGAIQGRIDNISSTGAYRYQKILSVLNDVTTMENRFLGVTKDETIGVYIGDIWVYDGTKYYVERFISKNQLKTEVILKLFTE